MTETALTALQGSVEKWQDIVKGIGEDKGPINCPLCIVFNNCDPYTEIVGLGCVGCPVMEKSGATGCNNTPYEAWDMYRVDSGEQTVTDQESKDLAQAELDFLISLLPD